jgi:hypothetical protein
MRARLATTIRRHPVRKRTVLAFAVPCAVAIACAFAVSTSARTRVEPQPSAHLVVPAETVAEAPLLDIPPPPAPLAVQEDDEPQQAKETERSSVMTPAPADTAREIEPTIRASTTSRLSRRSSLYERRF